MAQEGTIEQKDFIYKFAKNYEYYKPEPKDNMRAEDCWKRPNPVIAATAQLKRITDVDKFYRRLKAFLQHGLKIQTLVDTAFERMECEECRQQERPARCEPRLHHHGLQQGALSIGPQAHGSP